MARVKFTSITEQVAAHLDEELRRGRWRGTMPGRTQLVEELGVSGQTVEMALQMLVEEGLLAEQGAGRPRLITLPKESVAPELRVGVLCFDHADRNRNHIVDLQSMLEEAGHVVSFAPKTLISLAMDVKRIARMVKGSDVDAWVVIAAQRPVLEWFAEQPQPAFSLFGRRGQVRIAGAGPDHVPPTRAWVQRLISLGHRRIVILNRWKKSGSEPGVNERTALEEMEKHGLKTGSYNLPDWDPTPEGLRKILDELFRLTPPTALVLDEAFLFHAAKEYLAQNGILAPRDVSLISIDADATFDWCEPSVAHIEWDYRPLNRRIVRWADHVSRGKQDVRQTFSKSRFVDGGTVGPASS